MLYEEDPVENARICIAVAPLGCADCQDFHLRSILRRLSIPASEKTGDFPQFKEIVASALRQLSESTASIRVGIAGSTDTGVLATLLSAANAVGGADLVSILRVKLIDQCATPLQICLAFADRVGVPLEVQRADFLQAANPGAFDLVLMHGVVPFFPAARRHDYLAHIATWLAPQGVLISSTHLGVQPNPDADQKRARLAIDNLRGPATHLLNLDTATVNLLTDQLESTNGGGAVVTSVFADVAEAASAYEAAGLQVASTEMVHVDGVQASKQLRRYNSRCIVTCQRPVRNT